MPVSRFSRLAGIPERTYRQRRRWTTSRRPRSKQGRRSHVRKTRTASHRTGYCRCRIAHNPA